ncbi:MAG: hypothetical protein NUW21_12435, partial [Elusimicrobia bacterium]|nr:hypothetical protein [Elusimicrobiota bacterium]
MNSKERTEWIQAVGACVPDAVVKGMLAAAEAVDAPGRWEVSVCGAGLHSAGLRFFGAGDYARWRKACVKVFGLDRVGPDGPAEGLPWLTAAWDLRTGGWTSLRLSGSARGKAASWEFRPGRPPVRRLLAPAAFKAGTFGEPALDLALVEFSRLSPLATLSAEAPGWSLRFAQRLRWPLFAR